MEEDLAEQKKVEFLAGVLKDGETTTLKATDETGLVISNLCIPEVDPANADNPSRIFAHKNGRFLLATLVPGVCEMSVINYKVPPSEEVTIEASGPHPVHFIGYRFSLEDSSDSDILFGEEEEEEEEEARE